MIYRPNKNNAKLSFCRNMTHATADGIRMAALKQMSKDYRNHGEACAKWYTIVVPECDLLADTYVAMGYRPKGNWLVHFVDHITKDNKLGFYATTQCDMMANDWEVLPKEGDDEHGAR
jgi:hypothetical protein